MVTRVGIAVRLIRADYFHRDPQPFPYKGASRSGAISQSMTWGMAGSNATFPQRHISVDPGPSAPSRFGSP
jgi:hypothetical protein